MSESFESESAAQMTERAVRLHWAKMEDVRPLIEVLKSQLAFCDMGDKCVPCNQARAALAEFQKKYPQ